MPNITLIVRQFLKKEGYLTQPLLLALSGGPDSIALFYLLLKNRISFEVAHVDHGWRKESQQEAEQLQLLCGQQHIPFHLKKLDVDPKQANLEEHCREERYCFFKKILEERKLHALLSAHHADDQAETVLKRALEGSSLSNLRALQPIKNRAGLLILRPLLTVTKKELLLWLEKRNISYFIDSTNESPRFLRGRMRSELMPMLSDLFGKNIQKGLCQLAQHASEWHDYLEGVISPVLSQVKESAEGYHLPLSEGIRSSTFLFKVLLRHFFSAYGLSINTKLLDSYVLYVQRSKKKKSVYVKGYRIDLEREQIVLANFFRNNSIFVLLDKEV